MLIYRDTRVPQPTVFRTPSWLDGSSNLVRRIVRGQAWYWNGESTILPEVPADAWSKVEEDFEVADVGPLDPASLLRFRPELMVGAMKIADAKGRDWFGLVVFDGDGRCQLALGWGRRPGETTLSRIPEPWQVPLLAGATAARAELDAGRLHDVPVDAAMSWLLPLLCQLYHLSVLTIIEKRLLDDKLATGLIRMSAGYRPE